MISVFYFLVSQFSTLLSQFSRKGQESMERGAKNFGLRIANCELFFLNSDRRLLISDLWHQAWSIGAKPIADFELRIANFQEQLRAKSMEREQGAEPIAKFELRISNFRKARQSRGMRATDHSRIANSPNVKGTQRG